MLGGDWDASDAIDIDNTIFNLGGRASKVHYGSLGWDKKKFYVVDYRCMYAVEDCPSSCIMLYRLCDDEHKMFKMVESMPDYKTGNIINECRDNGTYEKFVDGLIRKITPIDAFAFQATDSAASAPCEDDVAKFLNSFV